MNKQKKPVKNRLLPSNMAAIASLVNREMYSSGQEADINSGEMTFTNSSMTRQYHFIAAFGVTCMAVIFRHAQQTRRIEIHQSQPTSLTF